MINQPHHPIPPIHEPYPKFEVYPCISKRIEDYSQADQDRLNNLKDPKKSTYKPFGGAKRDKEKQAARKGQI